MLDAAEGERLKEDGIERADRNADDEWKAVIRRCVRYAATTNREFTTDLLWALMAEHYPQLGTREPRAMGPVVLWAQRRELIEPTSRIELSERPEHHRYPCRVWRSLIYEEDGT